MTNPHSLSHTCARKSCILASLRVHLACRTIRYTACMKRCSASDRFFQSLASMRRHSGTKTSSSGGGVVVDAEDGASLSGGRDGALRLRAPLGSSWGLSLQEGSNKGDLNDGNSNKWNNFKGDLTINGSSQEGPSLLIRYTHMTPSLPHSHT